MKKTFDRSLIYPVCIVCGKGARLGVNKPHSQKRTKRIVRANVQWIAGLPICTRCRRTMKRDTAALRSSGKAASQLSNR